jgi:steroid 5-alpha reductase family enzyme
MFEMLGIVWIYIIIQMSVVWVLYRALKNPSIVDVSWSLGLMVSGLIYLWNVPHTFRIKVISCVLILWGLRLAGYLWYTRARLGKVDPRYTRLSDNWKIAKPLGFFLNFQLQGFFILIISSVFLFAAQVSSSQPVLLDWLGMSIALLGISGETLADAQLNRFQKKHRGKVCDVGLWNYCRHPNYYFEWLVWCGFTLFALHYPMGWLACLSPALLYVIFTQMTGPLTERGSLESRGQAYRDYQGRTPMFFPFKIKKSKR